MNKIFIGILLGFLLHKGLNSYYSYTWWNSQFECRFDSFEKNMECIVHKNGKVEYLKYILPYPAYTFKKWGWYF